jgi:hypothetical protein
MGKSERQLKIMRSRTNEKRRWQAAGVKKSVRTTKFLKKNASIIMLAMLS